MKGGAHERLADLEENSKTRGRPGASGIKPRGKERKVERYCLQFDNEDYYLHFIINVFLNNW